jgi:hypothetical protein
VLSGFQSAWSSALPAFLLQRAGTISAPLCIDGADAGLDQHRGGRSSVKFKRRARPRRA